jgi:hypothetical protein
MTAAPPGAGYLHLLGALHTRHGPDFPARCKELGGHNRFVAGGFPTDFTNARLTLRLKGEIELRGAAMMFLAQARVGARLVGQLLAGQPFEVTPAWSEQTAVLAPDPRQWKCLGSRHDRTETYGWGEVADVLRDVNVDILFVLHPLDVAPLPPFAGEPHRMKAGEDYEVDRSRLPGGWVMMDEVRIEFGH